MSCPVLSLCPQGHHPPPSMAGASKAGYAKVLGWPVSRLLVPLQCPALTAPGQEPFAQESFSLNPDCRAPCTPALSAGGVLLEVEGTFAQTRGVWEACPAWQSVWPSKRRHHWDRPEHGTVWNVECKQSVLPATAQLWALAQTYRTVSWKQQNPHSCPLKLQPRSHLSLQHLLTRVCTCRTALEDGLAWILQAGLLSVSRGRFSWQKIGTNCDSAHPKLYAVATRPA